MANYPDVTQFEKTDKLKIDDEERHAVGTADVARTGVGIRHVQCIVMAVAAFMAYSLRTNLSVAIVAMVRYNSTENSTEPELAPTYQWNEKTQGYVLSSFFWGYFMLQIPAGVITEKYGGHRFLTLAIIGSSALTFIMPQCAYVGGWFLVCLNRMLQGVCQGFVFPSIFTLLGLWAPPEERSTLSGVAIGAQLLGAVASQPISGYLCSMYGWPTVFYFFGLFGLGCGLVILCLGADSPARHRMISEDEKYYIQSSLGGAKEKLRIPWKNILTSMPFWSALLAMSCQAAVYLIFLTKTPTYLATVLKFSMEDNGLITALPYFVSWIMSFFFSWACDFIVGRGMMSLTTARKSFNSIAHFGAAICTILMGHSEDRAMSVFLLTAFMGAQGAVFAGVQSNFVDFAPNFSGTIFSIANFACACLGISGPILVGFVVTEAGSAAQWRIVFYICAFALIAGQIIYLIWGTAETQWWNWPDRYEEKNDTEEKEKMNPSQEKPA